MSQTYQHPGLAGAVGLAIICIWSALCGSAFAAECREVHLTDASTGAVLRGIEDLQWHEPSKRILLSAHDRWADPDSETPVANGIYGLSFPRLKREFRETSRDIDLPVPNLSELFQEENLLYPHGIALWEPRLPKAGFLDQRIGKQVGRLMVINHRAPMQERAPDGTAGTTIEYFHVAPNGELDHQGTYGHTGICAANDLYPLDEDTALVSLDRGACGRFGSFMELLLGRDRASVVRIDITRPDAPDVLDDGLSYANGIIVQHGDKPAVYVAESQADRIRRYDLVDGRLKRPATEIPVPGGPDNLFIDAGGKLLTAVHPDTTDLYFYMRRWPFFDHAPTRLVSLDISGDDGCEMLHDDPAGDPISGATGVLRIGGMLIAGSVTDDGLLLCKSPPKTTACPE